MTRWQMFKEALAEYRQRRREDQALRVTTRLLAQMHPVWNESLFDEPFLRKVGAQKLFQMTPRELAYEWSRQFSFREVRRREREVAQVTQIADQFLGELRQTIRRIDGHAERSAPARGAAARGLRARAAARL